MNFLTIDIESYYDREYSLTKLTTEEYINDPRFEVIGVSVKQDNLPAVWFSGTHEQTKSFLLRYDWANSSALAHNAIFDLSILAWKFGIIPAFLLDTLSMSRPVNGVEVAGSLRKLVSLYSLGEKGNEVVAAMGKHRLDFTPEESAAYGDYCINDTELTYKLFCKLNEDFSQEELELIHITLEMFISPIFQLDSDLLQARLTEVQEEKQLLLSGLKNHLNCETEEEVRKKLCSNPQFALVLQDLGVSVPKKISKTTEKETFAFAKTDLGFIALESHDNPLVQQLCSVRLGTKSTLEESRIERFLRIAERNAGMLPIPLKYCSTHSLRWAGLDQINMQNLPERDRKKRTLKKAIKSPAGFLTVNADSSQIEARICAWLAGQEDLVQAFRDKRDIYCEFATDVYGKEITGNNKKERFVGKESMLSLQFGVGKLKLQHSLKIKGDVDLDIYECGRIVNLYRRKNYNIPALWDNGEQVLKNLLSWPSDGSSLYFGKHDLIPVTPMGIRLPNGFYLRYPGLRLWKGQMVYDTRKGPANIWGGIITAHVVSSLARIIIGEQIRKVRERYRIGCLVHDSMVFRVEDSKESIDKMREFVHPIMSTPPSWAPGLPLAVEIKTGPSYGEC